MSSSSAEDAVNTRSVPRATVVRAVLTVAISALLTGVLFSYFYIEVFNAPEPHRLPVAVAGADTAHLQDAVGDGYRLVPVTDRQKGLDRLSRHEVYGVIALDGKGRSIELSYTSVDGTSVLSYMRPLAERISERSGHRSHRLCSFPGPVLRRFPGWAIAAGSTDGHGGGVRSRGTVGVPHARSLVRYRSWRLLE